MPYSVSDIVKIIEFPNEPDAVGKVGFIRKIHRFNLEKKGVLFEVQVEEDEVYPVYPEEIRKVGG